MTDDPAGGQKPPIHDVLAEMVRYAELAVELLDRLAEDSLGTLGDDRVSKVDREEPLVHALRDLSDRLNEWLTEAQETMMGRAFAMFVDFDRQREEGVDDP